MSWGLVPSFDRDRCVNVGLDPDAYAAFKRYLAENNVSIAQGVRILERPETGLVWLQQVSSYSWTRTS